MNLIIIIQTIAILFGLTDFLTERYPRLQRDIYHIALFVVTFLFAIKYYYGPDIMSYAPFYETVPTLSSIWSNPDDLRFHFEPGFATFCRILKDCGLSFYWMTAVLTILYFMTIHLFLRRIESKRSFALAILVVLEYNVVCYELRQCLAIVFFLLMVMSLDRKQYLWTFVCALCAVVTHKSGIAVVVPTLLYFLISQRNSLRTLSQLLLIALVVMLLLPMTNLSFSFLSALPLPSSILHSINHHLSLGRQIQVVFIVYIVVLMILVHFSQYTRSRMESIALAAMIGLVFIVMLYQYYYLLNRIRSYFTPLILVFIFRYVQQAEREHKSIPYGQLLKQSACFIMMLYMIHATYAIHRGDRMVKHKVNEACTVFELIDHRASDVQKSQMKKAELWWKEDFMKDDTNKIK